jgi:hypothetical protein
MTVTVVVFVVMAVMVLMSVRVHTAFACRLSTGHASNELQKLLGILMVGSADGVRRGLDRPIGEYFDFHYIGLH